MTAAQDKGIGRAESRLNLALFVFGEWSDKNGGSHLPKYATLSIPFCGNAIATFSLMASIFYWAVGLLIFWRKSGEWMDLIFSLACILIGAINIFGFPVAQTLSFNRRFCKCEEAWFCSGLNVKEKGLAHFLGFRVIDRPDGEAWFCGEISRRIEMVA